MDQSQGETGTNTPFERKGPDLPRSPVVLSVPHAGRDYSPQLLSSSRLPQHLLETLEDRYVDRLIEAALARGAIAIVARRPRAEIDLNRDEREIDPAIVVPPPPLEKLVPSARMRGGLGLIPARIGGAGAIWKHRIERTEILRRIEQIHRPYHAALSESLDTARKHFGTAILLDCHSMPPRAGNGAAQAEIIFGDLYGTTIAADFLAAAVQTARGAGFRTACNTPYAGGYITARHGRPADGIHALQLEIDRSLYLAGDMRMPGRGFERTAELIADVADALAARIGDLPQAIAAE